AGYIRFYDDSDDTNVKVGPVNNGTTVLDVTGSIDADVLIESGNAVPNATDHLGFFGGTTSAQLLAEMTDETGTGLLVFGSQPTIATPTLNSATMTGLINIDGEVNITGEVDVTGNLDLIHTATANDDHSFEIDTDAAGFGDIKSIDINYTTGAIAAGEDEGIVLINIDETLATGGDVFAFEVLATDGEASIYGLKVGALIGPIHQDSGVFANPTTGTDNSTATSTAAMIDGATSTTTAIFENDNEYILIGSAAVFEEIEFILTTGSSGAGIAPTFGYSISGAHQFTTFSPVDGTNGFRNTGVIAWDASDLTSHVANDDTSTFDIKITRTRNSLSTTPVLGYAKVASTTEYIWDKDGDVNIKDLTAVGNVDFGGADLEIPQGQTPDTDGDIDADFTDGTLVLQHGSAHAELGASTDVVMGKLIHSFAATLGFPDSLQGEIDNWPLKAINSTEYPHGIVVTAIRLTTSASSTYAVNVENWDTPTTINPANPTIDAITTSANTEAVESTITYDTIPAGQIIMLDLPTTDI
ncbi:hypothetical protein LCGC14_2421390, partial [marine sediment metagenome]